MSNFARWRREWGPLMLAALLAMPLFTPRLYAADEIKYFSHLRSAWFDHDVDYGNEYDHFLRSDPEANAWLRELRDVPSSTGRHLNDAPIGSAVLWAPFYIVADGAVIVSRAFGAAVPRDGYSAPYVWAVCIASLWWGLCGLALTYRICRREYGRWACTMAILGIWFATSLVFYLYITPPMAHANSLFAVAFFTWLWVGSRERRRSIGQWVGIGAAAGLMVLVRELNWLMLVPFGVDEASVAWNHWRERGLAGVTGNAAGHAAFAATLAVTVLPQFVTYQALHGTYGPTPFVVEKFSSYPAHAMQVLFSGFHGLYSWTPIIFAGTVGLLLLARRQPVLAAGMGLAFVVQVLVIGSYSTWWGGASFGARRFINCMPIFALGLAAALDAVPGRRRRLAGVLVVVLVVWNFGLAVQYATGLIPREDPVRMRTIVRNQLTVVPQRVAGVAWQFLTDRWSMVENPPGTNR